MADTKFKSGGTELCPECQKPTNWNSWFQKYICTACGWGGSLLKAGVSACSGCEYELIYRSNSPCTTCGRINPKPDNFKPKG